MFELLSHRRTAGDGWVQREELCRLWTKRVIAGTEARKRASSTTTAAIRNLEDQIQRRLAWMLPHFTIKLDSLPRRRATKYRLNIIRREDPWDFKNNEAPNTLPLSFSYRFRGGSRHVVHVRTWDVAKSGLQLEIEAVREPPQAEWNPPTHRLAYYKVRDFFFQTEIVTQKSKGGISLHSGDIWGIRDVTISEGSKGSTVRILTERTTYADLYFLRHNLDQPFPALRKQGTYREWLGMELEPRVGFCAPRDALCVAVMILVTDPVPTIFPAKQKVSGKWEPSAAGAASSHYYQVNDESPDLKGQVCGVVHREIGLKVQQAQINWLGFARGPDAGSSSAVLAVVELNVSVRDVLQKFGRRPQQADLEVLEPVALEESRVWLDKIPPKERGEFLELTLALTAIQTGFAEAL